VWPGRSVERKPRRRVAVFYSTSWLLVEPIVAVPAEPQLLLKVELPLNFSVYAMSWVHVGPPLEAPPA
jgi:hypothetical protein